MRAAADDQAYAPRRLEYARAVKSRETCPSLQRDRGTRAQPAARGASRVDTRPLHETAPHTAFRSRSDLAFFTFTMSSCYFAVIDLDNSASNLLSPQWAGRRPRAAGRRARSAWPSRPHVRMNGPPKPPANFSGLRYPSELIASSTLRPLARFSISLPAVDIGLLVT